MEVEEGGEKALVIAEETEESLLAGSEEVPMEEVSELDKQLADLLKKEKELEESGKLGL